MHLATVELMLAVIESGLSAVELGLTVAGTCMAVLGMYLSMGGKGLAGDCWKVCVHNILFYDLLFLHHRLSEIII